MNKKVDKLMARYLSKLPYLKHKIASQSRDLLVEQAASFIDIGRMYYGKDRDGILRDYRDVCMDTQLSIAGICNLEFSAQYVIENNITGSFVECGTWRGGAIAYWARSFIRNGGDQANFRLFGFDSFQGMPRMTVEDGNEGCLWLNGVTVDRVDETLINGELVGSSINLAPEWVCRDVVERSGYLSEHINIVKGWFQHTLPEYKNKVGPISVLRLDADLYESTKTCLHNLFDNVLSKGIIIIDDYGCFEGCRRAVDEFIDLLDVSISMNYIDYSSRYFFKP